MVSLATKGAQAIMGPAAVCERVGMRTWTNVQLFLETQHTMYMYPPLLAAWMTTDRPSTAKTPVRFRKTSVKKNELVA